MSGWQGWVFTGCMLVVIACSAVSIWYSRKSIAYHRITRKLHDREPLTEREQALLDRLPRQA